MYLADLEISKNSRKKKKRNARGRAGFGGKTAGKGHNGQKQRSGKKIRAQFEGGQTPISRRLPKRQLIKLPNKKEFSILGLDCLEKVNFQEQDTQKTISPELLIKLGILKKLKKSGLKILGNGELKKAVKVKAHAFSKSASEQIEKAGGTVELIQ